MQQPPQGPQSVAPPVVYTDAELRGLLANRAELKSLLESVLDRRGELSQEKPAGAAVRDLQSRLRELDERSARLDRDIGRLDDAIANAVARGVAAQTTRETYTEVPSAFPGPQPPSARDVAVGFGLGAVLFGVAGILLWRLAWSRAEKKFARQGPDHTGRFEQLQQSVDVIALEVERIAEGQRYVTKILHESLQPALGAGDAQPIQPAHKSAAPVRARGETV